MKFESLVFFILGGLRFVGSHTVHLQGGQGGRLPPPPSISTLLAREVPLGRLRGVPSGGSSPCGFSPRPTGSPPFPPPCRSPPSPSPWGFEEQIRSNTDVLCLRFRLCWGSMFPRGAGSVVGGGGGRRGGWGSVPAVAPILPPGLSVSRLGGRTYRSRLFSGSGRGPPRPPL